MAVQNRLRAFLEERGISVYRFRRDVGIADSTAYSLCNNPHQLPNSTVLSKICSTYRVQPNEVLVWIDEAAEAATEQGVPTSN